MADRDHRLLSAARPLPPERAVKPFLALSLLAVACGGTGQLDADDQNFTSDVATLLVMDLDDRECVRPDPRTADVHRRPPQRRAWRLAPRQAQPLEREHRRDR